MAAGLFLAFLDDSDRSRERWEQRLAGLGAVRTYRLASEQVPLPGSVAVRHDGLVAVALDDVSSPAPVVEALRSSPEVAGYLCEVVRPRRAVDDFDASGRLDCYLAFTNPGSPDRLDDFHEWYDTDHVPSLLQVPGIHSATRYRRVASAGSGSSDFGDFGYLTCYETDAAAAARALSEALAGAGDAGLADSTGDAGMAVTDAVAFDRYIQVFYETV